MGSHSRRTIAAHAVRIIAGKWRGRKVPVPLVEGLRPTTDRVRETVFNWLQYEIPGTSCCDLFAGSGILGLEALSRGAAQVHFVEKAPAAIVALKTIIHHLGADKEATVVATDALQWIAKPSFHCDIIFIDPPFATNFWEAIFADIIQMAVLPKFLYCETAKTTEPLSVPKQYKIHRQLQYGNVQGLLLQREELHADL